LTQWNGRKGGFTGRRRDIADKLDADGQKEGYDLELTRTISESVTVPVIASGGAGSLEHLHDALVLGKADAVLAASIFHYRTFSIRQVKEYLAKKGLLVRMG